VQEQYRLETTMQSKIRVYESGRAEQVIVCLGIMCLLYACCGLLISMHVK
jgi:hypothetical protein